MRQSRSAAFPSPAPGTGSRKPARVAVADVMERTLLDHIPINDTDFQALAAERAKAVREYILQTGKVEAARVFLAETGSGGVKSQGSRTYLQLR